MDLIKRMLALYVQEAIHEMAFDINQEVDTLNRYETQDVTKLVTQIKVIQPDRPPRYFTVRISEHV